MHRTSRSRSSQQSQQSSQQSQPTAQPSQRSGFSQQSQQSQPNPRRSRASQRSESQNEASQSQATQQVAEQDVERLVSEVIQYFLVMEQKRNPVKRQDITKMLQSKGFSGKIAKTIISHASKYLEEVFGYSLHEFDEKSGHFVLLNQVVLPENLCHQGISESNTILFLTLTAIFLSEGQIVEDEIWNMLNILGYRADEYKKMVLQDFVRKLYIDLEAVPQSDPPKVSLRWGERATVEFTKTEILNFASKIYGQPPEQFGNLHSIADKEAAERG